VRLNPEIKVFTYKDGTLRVIGKRGRERFAFTLAENEKYKLLRYMVRGKPDKKGSHT
jgi:hypothetical protein